MEYPSTTASVETLPNGLTLIFDPDPTAPVISAQLWVETGSIHENHLLGCGVSHFLEHMVFKGTRDFDADTLARTVQAAGGHWNAYTSFDRTVYYIDGPAQSLPVFLRCLTGLVFHPLVPESEFTREQDVIRREIDMGLDDPDHAATRLMLATAFQYDPRRYPVIGHRHRFDSLTHADLVAYHRNRYTTDRCFCVISGDFDPEACREMIMSLTDECLQGCGAEPVVAVDPQQLGPRRARETFAIPASRISMAWKSPPLEHPETPAFDVLAAILGRGRSSRLHRTLRDERGLALEISAFSWATPGREGIFGISADALPEHRDSLIQAIFAEIAGLQDEVLDQDLDKAKRQIAVSQFRSLTTASGRANDLGSNWHDARDLDFTRRHVAAVQAVRTEDIRNAAFYLSDQRLSLTVIDPMDAPVANRISRSKRQREDIQVHILGNGLTLALIPDSRVPMIHIQAAVRAGLPSEIPKTNGINQLLASSLPKGTRTRSAQEIAFTLESLGATISAQTGNNALLVHASGLAPDATTIAEVFADIVQAPAFPEEILKREKASQLAHIEESMQDPLHVAFHTLRDTAFCGFGYGLDPLGTAASLAFLDRSALISHHARHFQGANMTLAVAGDFDPASMLSLMSSLFADLPSGGPFQIPKSIVKHGIHRTVCLPKKQAVLAIGFPGVHVNDPQRHALAMIQEYAADMAGPLFSRIREDLGLAYQVGATQFLGYDSGLFSFYLATAPEQLDLAREELIREIRKIAEMGIPDEAFERVRSTVLSSLAIQQQSPSQTARHATLDLLFGHAADEHRRLTGIYQNVSAGDVRKTASCIFDSNPSITMVLPKTK